MLTGQNRYTISMQVYMIHMFRCSDKEFKDEMAKADIMLKTETRFKDGIWLHSIYLKFHYGDNNFRRIVKIYCRDWYEIRIFSCLLPVIILPVIIHLCIFLPVTFIPRFSTLGCLPVTFYIRLTLSWSVPVT